MPMYTTKSYLPTMDANRPPLSGARPRCNNHESCARLGLAHGARSDFADRGSICSKKKKKTQKKGGMRNDEALETITLW